MDLFGFTESYDGGFAGKGSIYSRNLCSGVISSEMGHNASCGFTVFSNCCCEVPSKVSDWVLESLLVLLEDTAHSVVDAEATDSAYDDVFLITPESEVFKKYLDDNGLYIGNIIIVKKGKEEEQRENIRT